jgi:hypothetical protein
MPVLVAVALTPFPLPTTPLGTYNSELRPNTTAPCTPCPGHLTTSQSGSDSVNDCRMCAFGYGGVNCTTQCGSNAPTYGPAGREEGSQCEACPVIPRGFYFDYLAVNHNFSPAVVARPGAVSAADCLAEFAQIEDVAWYMGGSLAMASAGAATFEGCVSACKDEGACEYLTFDYVAQQCWLKKNAADGAARCVCDIAFRVILYSGKCWGMVWY